VAVVLTGGEANDVKGYEPLMAEDGPPPKVMLADRGYDADAILEDLKARGATPVIPPKSNRTGHTIRQDRRQLPRLHPYRIGQTVGQSLRQ